MKGERRLTPAQRILAGMAKADIDDLHREALAEREMLRREQEQRRHVDGGVAGRERGSASRAG